MKTKIFSFIIAGLLLSVFFFKGNYSDECLTCESVPEVNYLSSDDFEDYYILNDRKEHAKEILHSYTQGFSIRLTNSFISNLKNCPEYSHCIFILNSFEKDVLPKLEEMCQDDFSFCESILFYEKTKKSINERFII